MSNAVETHTADGAGALDLDDEVMRFATNAVARLATLERNIPWLHRKTGIAESTLRYQLLVNPLAMSHINARRIAKALGASVDEVVAQ